MEGQYYLKWNNHHNTLISVFDSLLGSGKHVDCTLAAEGHELGAHKVVLSACSPYLESLLNKPSEKHPIIIFNDVKFDELKAILEYMYRGEVNVLQEQLTGFLKAAEALQIKGLTDQGGGGRNGRGGTDESDKEKENSTNGGKRKLNRPNSSDVPTAENQQQDDNSVMSSNKRKRQRRPSHDKMSDGQADSSNSCDATQAPPSNPPVVANAPLPPVTKIETDRLSNASASSGASQQQQPLPLVQTQVIIKEKIEPPEVLLQPKTEYIDDSNNENEHIEDLTLDDDEDDGGYMARPGPSHGDSHDYNTSWHLRDRPMEETFLTAQDVMGNQNNSQGSENKEDVKTNLAEAIIKTSPKDETGLTAASSDIWNYRHALQCPVCSYRATRKAHLVRHVNDLHNPFARQYECGDCGFLTKRTDKLKQHIKRHYSGDGMAGGGSSAGVPARRGRKPKSSPFQYVV